MRLTHEYTGLTCDPETGVVYGKRGKPLTRMGQFGYLKAQCWINSKNVAVQHHRIVWECVNGPIPPSLCINHINGIKTDNRIANLEMVTRGENTRHAVRTGLKPPNWGVANGRAKLDEACIRDIRAAGYATTVHAWARFLGVSPAAVQRARAGVGWAHVT